jgi:hypothetical protein
MTYALIVNESGRHGFSVVGPFATLAEAEAWRDDRKLEGFTHPFTAPDAWTPNDGSHDDTY